MLSLHAFRFARSDLVYFQLHSRNEWKWSPAVITEKLGLVNYAVRADTQAGERIIKDHTNKLKKRYDDTAPGNNVLLDLFDIAAPPQGEVEPIIIPEPEEEVNESIYEDAEENEEIIPEVPLRRTTRANAGIPPNRYSP